MVRAPRLGHGETMHFANCKTIGTLSTAIPPATPAIRAEYEHLVDILVAPFAEDVARSRKRNALNTEPNCLSVHVSLARLLCFVYGNCIKRDGRNRADVGR